MVNLRNSGLLMLVCLWCLPLAAQQIDAGNPFVSGDTESLKQRYQTDLSINPFDPIALNNLAVTRAEVGDVYAAQDMLERASRLAPNNLQIKRNLTRVQQWKEVQASDFIPPTRYALPAGFGEQGLPPAPPPLWNRVTR